MSVKTISFKFMLACAIGATFIPAVSARALFYETFDEMDPRLEGVLPEDVERIRFGGRLFGTEIEVEAPAGNTDTRSLARYVYNPTGLSLITLRLEDRSRDGSGDFSADGGVSLLESILLDRGDWSGRAVVSWMAYAEQSTEPGGTMFPETDSRIDAGPEGLNLIGFGGVLRDFDTGEPIPGLDFSNQITASSANGSIESLGIGYEPGLPYFFVLDFDLERSLYKIWVNGVLVRDSMPFFDVQGETGKTLRELELISSARGLGAFGYDYLFQFDPDASYHPIEFRAPVIAGNTGVIPLFTEEFDDEPLGTIAAQKPGDLFGSRITVSSGVSVVEDQSLRTLARAGLSPQSQLTAHFPTLETNDSSLRCSFCVEPASVDGFALQIGDRSFLQFQNGELRVNQTGSGVSVPTGITILPNLPHWFSITIHPNSGNYEIDLYRAQSADNAQTIRLETSGNLGTLAPFQSIQFSSQSAPVYLDNILVVQTQTTSTSIHENRTIARLHEGFENVALGASASYPGGVVTKDPSGWSFHALQTTANHTLQMVEDTSIFRSARIAWSAIPETSTHSGTLQLHLADSNGMSVDRIIAGFRPDGLIGVDTQGTGELDTPLVPYRAGMRNSFDVVLDLLSGTFTIRINGTKEIMGPISLGNGKSAFTLTGVSLTGTGPGTIWYDDLLVTDNYRGSIFDPIDSPIPQPEDGTQILFIENFENNPAHSERIINLDSPRQSGLPIETNTTGFSNRATTEIAGTRLWIGAPSAEAGYVEDSNGGSLYALFIADTYAPTDFALFAASLPMNPISTLRTIPYAMVVPELAAAPVKRFLQIQWTAQALQTDQIGLALFLDTEDAAIPIPRSTIVAPAPWGNPIVAFGQNGVILADRNGDGELDDTSETYRERQPLNFTVTIDRMEQHYTLRINERTIVQNIPLNDVVGGRLYLQRLGWFTTLVNSTDGSELQQSVVGGGRYIIDNILIFEAEEFTSIDRFLLHE